MEKVDFESMVKKSGVVDSDSGDDGRAERVFAQLRQGLENRFRVFSATNTTANWTVVHAVRADGR